MDVVEALYGRGARFEEDAAVTELFLCANEGLPSALVKRSPCAALYLAPTIARVRPDFLLPVGSAANEYLSEGRIGGTERVYPARIANHQAWVIGLPHPNRRGLTREARREAVQSVADAIRELQNRLGARDSSQIGLQEEGSLGGEPVPSHAGLGRRRVSMPSRSSGVVAGRSRGTRDVERQGPAALTEELASQGIEVTAPIGSSDVDVIAVASESGKPVPIHMVAAAGKSFSVRRKCGDVPVLEMVYVWNLASPDAIECYAMPWTEARMIAELHSTRRPLTWSRIADASRSFRSTWDHALQ